MDRDQGAGAIIGNGEPTLVRPRKGHGALECLQLLHLHVCAHGVAKAHCEDVILLLLREAVTSSKELEELILIIIY